MQAAHEAEEGVTFQLTIKQLQALAAMVTGLFDVRSCKKPKSGRGRFSGEL